MNIPFKKFKSLNGESEPYVFNKNNYRGILRTYRTDAYNSAYDLLFKGVIAYKFVGKCHLPPNHFRFTEFYRKEDERIYREFAAASKYRIDIECETRTVTIAKSESDKIENEQKSNIEEEEITGPAIINKLGDYCLMEIFSYLPLEKRFELEQVCTRWRDVSQRAWNDVRVLGFSSFHVETYNLRFFKKLLMRCGIYLRTLKLDIGRSFHALQDISKYCHNLATIVLISSSCDENQFNGLSEMEKLQAFRSDKLNRKYIEKCLLSLPKTIKSIHITFCNAFSSKTLPTSIDCILKEFKSLNSLTLPSCDFRKDLIETISQMEKITKLNLPFSSFDGGLNVLTNLSNLEHLNLEGVHDVNNNFLACLSKKCKKLKYLNMNFCKNVSDEGIRELKKLDHLEELFINFKVYMTSSVTDLALGQLKGIRILACEYNPGVRDSGIKQLMENSPNLEELYLEGTSISEETLQSAMKITKDRNNPVFLYISAHHQKEFIMRNKCYSSFLRYNQEKEHDYSEPYGGI